MVSRIVAWSLLGLVVVILLGTWIVNAGSSKTTTTTKETPTSDLGRFQAVRTTPDQIILLDTTTGELYKAGPDDIKEYKKLNDDSDSDSDKDDDPDDSE